MCFSTTRGWNPKLLPSGHPAGAGLCWVFAGQPHSSSVVAVLTQAGPSSPGQAGYKRLKAACGCPEQLNTAWRAQSPREAAPKHLPAPGREHPGVVHVPRLYPYPSTGVMCSRCLLAMPGATVDTFTPGWAQGLPLGTCSHSPDRSAALYPFFTCPLLVLVRGILRDTESF